MQNLIYVIASDGTPLMPTKRVGRVRHYLKNKEAIIINYKPFTIKFVKETNKYTQDITLGIDPGRTNIGLACVNSTGKCLYSALVESNNKQVTKRMSERKTHRMASRRGERKRRQRRAIKNNTIISSITKKRMLPGCEKPIIVKYIKNSKAKFNNRKRNKEWLTPTVNHLILTHINLVKKAQRILPISKIIIEVNKFDFQKLEDAKISGTSYTKGTLSGFDSVEDYISFTQKNTCLLCKNSIEHYHHIVPKSKGGSDSKMPSANPLF